MAVTVMAVAETAVLMAHAAAGIPPSVAGHACQLVVKVLLHEVEEEVKFVGIAAAPTTGRRARRQRSSSTRRECRRLS
jgi:hypothetical protein